MLGQHTRLRVSKNWLRLIGIALLIFLLWHVDLPRMAEVLRHAAPALVIIAILLNVPQIFLKAFRWRFLLHSQGIEYGILPASLSYFGSIFIGLLTPGRLGELVKTAHVSQDCKVPKARAFSSVLVDRLFDLYALLILGGAALISQQTGHDSRTLFAFGLTAALLTLPLLLFLSKGGFRWLASRGPRKFFASEGWLTQLHTSLRELSGAAVFIGVLLTAIAYALFFTQCFLLSQSLGVHASFLQISYAVALGSLITLLPISISGLGTREAAIVAYLKTLGVPAEAGLGFSLLVFLTFYVAGGLIGAIAWYIKPVEWRTKEGASGE